LVVALVVKTLFDAGEFRHIVNQGNDKCVRYRGARGMEDMAVMWGHPLGRVLWSSDDRHQWMAHGMEWKRFFAGQPLSNQTNRIKKMPKSERGAIYSFDVLAPEPRLQKIKVHQYTFRDFHPHGIALAKNTKGSWRLYVVNHRSDGPGEFVDVFKYNDTLNELTWDQTVVDPLFRNINDVAYIDDKRFYVTNWLYYQQGTPLNQVETFLQRPWGYVLLCVHEKRRAKDWAAFRFTRTVCEVVVDGLRMPNGIDISADGKTVFIASSVGREVLIYDRQPENNLTLRTTVDVGTGVDNVVLDRTTGAVYAGCHPQMLSFVRYAPHAKDPSSYAPSQVLRLLPVSPDAHGYAHQYQPEQIFLSDGADLSASSVGFVYHHKLLIGAVFDDGILVCDGF